MSVAVGEETSDDPKEEQTEKVTTKQIKGQSSTPKTVPVSLNDASLQVLLSCPPVISHVISNSPKALASTSSSCQ